MIGKDDNEEVVLKVTDKRKFNFDGSVREGVEIPKEEKPIFEPTKELVEDYESAPVAPELETTPNIPMEEEDEDYPDAENPASFVNFLSTLATNAAASLGAMPHPATGQRSIDLESGKYWIEVLSMLKDKTQGNLHPKEAELFSGILSDLKMQFVQINRMAEEKLKQQAAQKFSAKDILGRK
jgi:hypothetical protein